MGRQQETLKKLKGSGEPRPYGLPKNAGRLLEVASAASRKRIEATQTLAKSPNTKIIMVGNKQGLPLILAQ